MTESRREIWTRAASETIARQQKFDDDNIGDRAYLLRERRQQQQQKQQRQARTSTDEKIQLEEDVKVAREAAVWLCVVAEALAGEAEEGVAAFVEATVRGNAGVLRCKDMPVLLPDAHDPQTNKGAVTIRNALKRELHLSDEAQEEEEWALEGRKAGNKIKELPVPTPLDDEDYDDIFIAEQPASLPALLTRPSSQQSIAKHASEDGSNRSEGEDAAPTPPLTPPRASPSSLSNEPPAVEPPPLDLKSPTPPPPPRTYFTNPLGGTFNTPINQPCVIFVVNDIFCSERVLNGRRKAKKVPMELEKGCMHAETLEWIIRGLTSPMSKREMAQRLHGLEFVGPQWDVPKYKTDKELRHLLKGVNRCSAPTVDTVAVKFRVVVPKTAREKFSKG
eukprot:jgi/Undpi1/7908/HiC_scaffold_24.g10380.m1